MHTLLAASSREGRQVYCFSLVDCVMFYIIPGTQLIPALTVRHCICTRYGVEKFSFDTSRKIRNMCKKKYSSNWPTRQWYEILVSNSSDRRPHEIRNARGAWTKRGKWGFKAQSWETTLSNCSGWWKPRKNASRNTAGVFTQNKASRWASTPIYRLTLQYQQLLYCRIVCTYIPYRFSSFILGTHERWKEPEVHCWLATYLFCYSNRQAACQYLTTSEQYS